MSRNLDGDGLLDDGGGLSGGRGGCMEGVGSVFKVDGEVADVVVGVAHEMDDFGGELALTTHFCCFSRVR